MKYYKALNLESPESNSSPKNRIQFRSHDQKIASIIISRHCSEQYRKKQKHNDSIKALYN